MGEASREILEYLYGRVEGRILDLGGGVGAYAQILRARGFDVTVGEMDRSALAALSAAGIPNLDMNATNLAELAGRFDTVVMIEVLEHVPEYAAFLKQAMAAARRKLVFTVPCNDAFDRLFRYNLTFNHIAVSDHVNQFTTRDIESLMRDSGWRYRIGTGSHLFPGSILQLITETLKGNPLGSLAALPLRILARAKFLPKALPSRIFVEAEPGDSTP